MDLGLDEAMVLKLLQKVGRPEIAEDEISIEGMNSREISAAVSWLEVKEFVSISKIEERSWRLGEEGLKYLKLGLPEFRGLNLLRDENTVSVRTVMEKLPAGEGRIALAQLAKFGIRPENGSLSLPPNASEIEKKLTERQNALSNIEQAEPSPEILENLRARESVLVEVKKTKRFISLTERGKTASVDEVPTDRIDVLTPAEIASGTWKGREFRKYDLNAPVERIYTAWYHPLGSLIRRIREIFLKMGFTEMGGHYIEYAGWNMDALFIPQDHPAREMQDTFYLEAKEDPPLEHEESFAIFSKVHEHGISGYTGWGTKWRESEARRLLLRTHTTVSTIRYLYEHREAPQAMFSVEKVFRHESVDWKHLAELHQVEGAVYSKDSSLSSLKWLMREFYAQLGFTELEFIPSYYPYTEPSMDVVAIMDGRELELGGSGVFRPEITKSIGLKHPVIAWGLGLERLAMSLFGMKDIRQIYNSDLDWLRTFTIRY